MSENEQERDASNDELEKDDSDDSDEDTEDEECGDDKFKHRFQEFLDTIPKFSLNVETVLMNESNCWTDNKIRSQFISELSIYLLSSDLNKCFKSTHYKAIAIDLISKYGGLRKSIGDVCKVENKERNAKKRAVQPWVYTFLN